MMRELDWRCLTLFVRGSHDCLYDNNGDGTSTSTSSISDGLQHLYSDSLWPLAGEFRECSICVTRPIVLADLLLVPYCSPHTLDTMHSEFTAHMQAQPSTANNVCDGTVSHAAATAGLARAVRALPRAQSIKPLKPGG